MKRMPQVLRCVLVLVCLGAAVVHRLAVAQDPVVEQAKRDVAVLTADSLYGRGYSPDGALRAAYYVREQFQSIGLSVPDTSGYFQSFPLTVDIVRKVPSLVLNGDSLEPGVDFVPHGITGGGTIAQTKHVVSVGTGLVVPELALNAYRDVDVSDAVVVIDREVPKSIRTDSSLAPRDWSIFTRIEGAVERGASAVLVATDRLIFSMYPYETSVPVISVARHAVPDTIETAALDVAVSVNESLTSQNVIGLVEGTSSSDSLIMLTAHYDHVGSWGDSIYYPGANDNASGTALLLALARYFDEHPLPYTVVCVAFSGEEHGLLGSEYFAQHSPFDLSRVRFLLNFDMVASGTDGFMAVGGTEFPEEFQRLRTIGDSLGVGPIGQRDNVPNSDHYPLIERGVPGFFLYARGGHQPYHHVNDVMETLDWDVFMNAYNLSIEFLEDL